MKTKIVRWIVLLAFLIGMQQARPVYAAPAAQCNLRADDDTPAQGQTVKFTVETSVLTTGMVFDFDDGTGLIESNSHVYTALGGHHVMAMGRVGELGTVRCLYWITVVPAAESIPTEDDLGQLQPPAGTIVIEGNSNKVTLSGDFGTLRVNGNSNEIITISPAQQNSEDSACLGLRGFWKALLCKN